MVTIGYCCTLNRRLKRLQADEQSLKATIAELITATEIAERAVSELKRTAHENDATRSANGCGRPSAAASSSTARSRPATSC